MYIITGSTKIHNPPRQIVKERLQVGELEVVLDLEKDVAVSTAGVPTYRST